MASFLAKITPDVLGKFYLVIQEEARCWTVTKTGNRGLSPIIVSTHGFRQGKTESVSAHSEVIVDKLVTVVKTIAATIAATHPTSSTFIPAIPTSGTQRRIFRKDPAHPQGAYGKNPAPREKDRVLMKIVVCPLFSMSPIFLFLWSVPYFSLFLRAQKRAPTALWAAGAPRFSPAPPTGVGGVSGGD